MTKHFIIYGKEMCPNCSVATNLCNKNGHTYDYKTLGTDYEVDELRDLCPAHISSLPQVFEVNDDESTKYIGGVQVFQKYINGELNV